MKQLQESKVNELELIKWHQKTGWRQPGKRSSSVSACKIRQSEEKKEILWVFKRPEGTAHQIKYCGHNDEAQILLPSFEKPTQPCHVYLKRFNFHFEKPTQPNSLNFGIPAFSKLKVLDGKKKDALGRHPFSLITWQ